MIASLRGIQAAVLGGGLIGLSIAYELACRGACVTVFERTEAARGASWAGAGMLAPFTEGVDDPALLDLLLESRNRYPEFVGRLIADGGIDPHLRLDGILDVARDRDALHALHERAAILTSRGYAFEMLDARAAVALEPALGMLQHGAMLVCDEGQVDNRRLGRALLAACERRGVDVREHCPVESIETDSRRVLGLRTANGFVNASAVINATGAWAAQFDGLPPSCHAPVFPIKGQMLALEIPKGFMRHVTWAHGIYFVPRQDGRLLVGATVENCGFDTRTNAEGMSTLLESALRAAPALRTFTVSEMWAGLRPATADGRPFIGPTPIEGYFLATGHYRNGILLAPVTAALIADALGGRSNDMLAPFAPGRALTEGVPV